MSLVEQDASLGAVPADARACDCTVIVPAYQGRETISDCLRSVLRALEGWRGEVVVIESSGDGTVELVRAEFPMVRVVALTQRVSAGEARNRGVEAARAATLFFVDQDCVVPVDWIARLEASLSEPGVGMVGGSVGVRNPDNLSGFGVYCLEFLYHFPSRHPATRNENFLLGCNLACRASVFEGGRFPARTLAEDVLFTYAVREAGWDTVYDPRVEVLHWNRAGWREFFRYNGRMGRAAAQYQRRLQLPFVRIVLRLPALVFLTPLVMLPRIAWGLLGNWPYLLRFLLLLPVCLLGNWAWCLAFYREIVRPTTDD